jgi:hypothetical protein
VCRRNRSVAFFRGFRLLMVEDLLSGSDFLIVLLVRRRDFHSHFHYFIAVGRL